LIVDMVMFGREGEMVEGEGKDILVEVADICER
jgi:hypothetical protein